MIGCRHDGSRWQPWAAGDYGDNRSSERAYDDMDGIPYVVDERNLIGDKVEECKDDKRGDEPGLGDEGEVWVQLVHVQPAYRERESEHGQVCIQARGECKAERCSECDNIHSVCLPICMLTPPRAATRVPSPHPHPPPPLHIARLEARLWRQIEPGFAKS